MFHRRSSVGRAPVSKTGCRGFNSSRLCHMTHPDIVDVAEPSHPTDACESKAKSPIWRTMKRIARSVGVACCPAAGEPLTRDQEKSLLLHAAVAEELRVRRAEVIKIAHKNIALMRSVNPHASPLLDEWNRILRGTTDQIVAQILDPSYHSRDLRQVTPFAGVLTPAQRLAVYRSFTDET